MNTDDFNALIGAFVAETQEFVRSLEANLLTLEGMTTAEARSHCVKQLFRAAHSIKGSAMMFGFEGLSAAAHDLEDAFATLRDRANLSQLAEGTINALLDSVDHLQTIMQAIAAHQTPEEPDITEHRQAIALVKQQLADQYGHPEPPLNPNTQPANQEIIKAIFEHELPTVLNRLEAELSQAQADQLTEAIAAIRTIHYQLSGMATMLQLPNFGQLADQLDHLLQQPALTLDQLQNQGWAIAQTLHLAKDQILQGQPLTVSCLPLVVEADAEKVEGEGEAREAGEVRAVGEVGEAEEAKETGEVRAVPLPISPSLYPSTPPPLSTSTDSTWQRPTIRVDVERLSELVNLVGELVINRTNLQRQESQLRTEVKCIRQSISELNQAGSLLREEYDRMSVLNPAKVTVAAGTHRSGTYFDSLEMDRYTEFHSTAQSVIETTQDIASSATKIDDVAAKFERSTEQLRRITEQLRNRVMQLRVVPFSRAVDYLPRALRDLSRLHNKDVNLLLLGRDTKIDESLLDALRDPLVHLVRNAFDHGIESPAERQAVGKPPTGQIEIEARHQGGQTIVTISDDGRGIDADVIRRQIVERGLVTPEQATSLPIAELYDFLFWAGFSTKGSITDLSGRGVGLDVVRTNLRQVRGSVKVDSRPGKGTSFILKLPLMLSITDALMVKVDHNILAVPIDSVEEILHTRADQIHMAGNQPMLHWREEFIRLVRLQDLVQFNTRPSDLPSPDPLTQEHMPVLILATNEDVVAIAVERLLGQQEIVVKPLPAPLSKPKGIVGSTILGDGQVVTILDVDDLITQFTPQTSTAVTLEDNRSQVLAPIPLSQPQILIVDDSYTIRQLLSLTLTRARYRVVQAKDGQDALEKLQGDLNCSLIVADIEMPRMDGFELLQALKAHPKLSTIPVVMLTSRSGTKHRQMGMDLGASAYFTKPYSEAQLLDAIAKLIQPAP